jgi:hypothetical protein
MLSPLSRITSGAADPVARDNSCFSADSQGELRLMTAITFCGHHLLRPSLFTAITFYGHHFLRPSLFTAITFYGHHFLRQ